MKKAFVAAGLMLALGLVQAVQKIDDGVAITFVPVSAKAEKLVAIELVGSNLHKDRYKRLEQSVFRNDWRPLLFAADQVNPGKCTVIVLSDSYDVDCWLVHNDRADDTLRIKVKTPDSVIRVVNHFSKKWLQ